MLTLLAAGPERRLDEAAGSAPVNPLGLARATLLTVGTVETVARDLELVVGRLEPEEIPDFLAALERARVRAMVVLLRPGAPAADEDRLLTMPEVAERLGVHEDTARGMGRRGELPVTHVGRSPRVRAAALRQWQRRREAGRNQ